MPRVWEKHAPFLGRTGSVFGKNMLRFREKHAPFLGKTVSVSGKKHAPFLGKNMLRFWETQCPFWGKTGSVFGKHSVRFGEKLARCLDWLGTKLKSHKFGFGFSRFKTGCLLNKSTGGKLEG